MKKNPEARKLWKRVVIGNAMNQCELREHPDCEGVAHDGHHLIGADYQKYELDPRNGFAVCRLCHNWVHEHENDEFIEWLEDNRPELADWILGGSVCYHSPTMEELNEQVRQLRIALGLDPYGEPDCYAPIGT